MSQYDNYNDIYISKMVHPIHVNYFLKMIMPLIDQDTINIVFNTPKILPSACVPVSGIIDNLRKSGKRIYCHYDKTSYLSTINFNTPYKVNDHMDSLAYPFAKVWKFTNSDEVTKLVDAFIKEIISVTECPKGVIEGLVWSLNEVMDNVIQHSLCRDGYIMGVYHKSTDYLLFDVYDNGQGIFNSLRDSEYHPRNAADAISIAVQEGKTRDKKIGQGNGLWGLYNIIQKNKGKLCITSAGSAMMLKSDSAVNKFDNLQVINTKNGTTSVDISFNCKQEVSIAEALGGYVPPDIKFENMVDASDCIQFNLSSETTGFGTRVAGEKLRNTVMNHLTRIDSPQRINIDFNGISVISSSFADEFIGKLILELGFYKFNNMVKISRVNQTIEAIINRSVYQRMAEVFKDTRQ